MKVNKTIHNFYQDGHQDTQKKQKVMKKQILADMGRNLNVLMNIKINNNILAMNCKNKIKK